MKYIQDVCAARDFKRLKQSWRYSYLNEGDKARLDEKLAELDLRRESRKKLLNSVFSGLLQSNSGSAKWDELANWMTEIHETVTNLRRVFDSISMDPVLRDRTVRNSGVGTKQQQDLLFLGRSDESTGNMPFCSPRSFPVS